jgi:hypothetical protein
MGGGQSVQRRPIVAEASLPLCAASLLQHHHSGMQILAQKLPMAAQRRGLIPARSSMAARATARDRRHGEERAVQQISAAPHVSAG